MIFENQPLKLKSQVKQKAIPVNITGASAKYLYWQPGTASTDPPDGEFEATVLNAESGTIEYDIPQDILTVGEWTFRGVAVFGNGDTPSETVLNIDVKPITRDN